MLARRSLVLLDAPARADLVGRGSRPAARLRALRALPVAEAALHVSVRADALDAGLVWTGLWAVSGTPAAGACVVGDRTALVLTVGGPRLGALEMEACLWLLARWRAEGAWAPVPVEAGDLADALGWQRDEGSIARCARALRALTDTELSVAAVSATTGRALTRETGSLLVGRPPREDGVLAGMLAPGPWLAARLRVDALRVPGWEAVAAAGGPTAVRALVILMALWRGGAGAWRCALGDAERAALGVLGRVDPDAPLRRAVRGLAHSASLGPAVDIDTDGRGQRILVARRV